MRKWDATGSGQLDDTDARFMNKNNNKQPVSNNN